MKVKMALPVEEHEIWAQSAVDGLVGQRPLFNGHPSEVIAAELVEGRPHVTLEVPDGAGPVLPMGRNLCEWSLGT